MASTITSCSTAIMAAKSILQIVLRIIDIFTSAFARKFDEQLVAFTPKVEASNFTKNKLSKLVNLMKIHFLF